MAKEIKHLLIEISEEAYKQNTVYRPWSEIKANNPVSEANVVPHGQLQPLKNALKAANR